MHYAIENLILSTNNLGISIFIEKNMIDNHHEQETIYGWSFRAILLPARLAIHMTCARPLNSELTLSVPPLEDFFIMPNLPSLKWLGILSKLTMYARQHGSCSSCYTRQIA